jgi:dihydroxyacetone kinase-like protein
MGVDGGATGPLFGMLFMGMSDAVEGKEALESPDVAAAFEAGLASVQKQTKARVGDKTLIDALVPAVAALRAAADDGADPATALEAAAQAAAQGAESTKDLQARFGRARNIGEASKGYADPGATSVSLVFRGFAEALRSSSS